MDIFEFQTRTLYPVVMENLRLFEVLTLNHPNIKPKETIERNLTVTLTENDYFSQVYHKKIGLFTERKLAIVGLSVCQKKICLNFSKIIISV